MERFVLSLVQNIQVPITNKINSLIQRSKIWNKYSTHRTLLTNCRTRCNPVEDPWCTESLLFLNVHHSHTISHIFHFRRVTSFSCSLRSLYSLFWDSRKLFNSFFCWAWICCWNFFSSFAITLAYSKSSSKSVWVPMDHSSCPISAPRPRTHGSHHNTHHASAQVQVRGGCPHSPHSPSHQGTQQSPSPVPHSLS